MPLLFKAISLHGLFSLEICEGVPSDLGRGFPPWGCPARQKYRGIEHLAEPALAIAQPVTGEAQAVPPGGSREAISYVSDTTVYDTLHRPVSEISLTGIQMHF
jgi:hypothetical protein